MSCTQSMRCILCGPLTLYRDSVLQQSRGTIMLVIHNKQDQSQRQRPCTIYRDENTIYIYKYICIHITLLFDRHNYTYDVETHVEIEKTETFIHLAERTHTHVSCSSAFGTLRELGKIYAHAMSSAVTLRLHSPLSFVDRYE